MGEEAHLRTPFPFFIDLPPGPAQAKAKDRNEQMAGVFNETLAPVGLPDPNDEKTFQMAKLAWSEFDTEVARRALARFRTLTGWRRERVWPLAATPCLDATTARYGNAVIINWVFAGGTLSMALNPGDQPVELQCLLPEDVVSTGDFHRNCDVLQLGPWAAVSWCAQTG